jgi:protein O-mannosyl-transferase
MTEFGGSWQRVVWLAVTIGVVTGLLGVGRGFVLDDPVGIEQSLCVTGPFDVERIFGTNFWCEQDTFRSIQSWRPWTVLVWWGTWRLGGGTLPFTLLNLALHGACIRALYDLGLELALPQRAAALGTLLFAPMAIHVDAVAPAVGAGDLWSALFVLLAARFFLRGSPWCVPLGILALLSKESGVLALAWVAAAFVLAGAASRSSVQRKRQALLVVAMAGCTLGILYWRADVLGAWGASRVPFFVNPLVDADFGTRLTTSIGLIGRYHRLTLLGDPLSADYAYAALGVDNQLPWVDRLAGFSCLALWCVVGWRFRARAPIRILIVWLLGTTVFVSNAVFVLPALFAERLFYLPSALIALLGGLVLDSTLAGGARPRLVGAAVIVFVLVQSTLSSLHVLRFRDEMSIVRHTVETTPDNARARMWLANRLLREGDPEEAREHVEVAASLLPTWGAPKAVFAVLEDLSGRPETALVQFREAMLLDPHDAEVADLFIQFLLRHGHIVPARAVYEAHSRARGRPDPRVTVPGSLSGTEGVR